MLVSFRYIFPEFTKFDQTATFLSKSYLFTYLLTQTLMSFRPCMTCKSLSLSPAIPPRTCLTIRWGLQDMVS